MIDKIRVRKCRKFWSLCSEFRISEVIIIGEKNVRKAMRVDDPNIVKRLSNFGPNVLGKIIHVNFGTTQMTSGFRVENCDIGIKVFD